MFISGQSSSKINLLLFTGKCSSLSVKLNNYQRCKTANNLPFCNCKSRDVALPFGRQVLSFRLAEHAVGIWMINTIAGDNKMFSCDKKCSNIICQRHGLAVPHAGDRSYVTGSIHSWSRSRLHTYRVAADSKNGSSLRSTPRLLFNFHVNTIWAQLARCIANKRCKKSEEHYHRSLIVGWESELKV